MKEEGSTHVSALSPKISPLGHSSPLGPLDKSSTRKLLVNLISTMNSTFPDYDFSEIRPDDFEHQTLHSAVVNSINSMMLLPLEKKHPALRMRFWKMLNQVIDFDQSEIYSFLADTDSDVFGAGKLWSFNYFMYNKKQKKIVFLMASAQSKLHPLPMSQQSRGDGSDQDDDDDRDDDISDSNGSGGSGSGSRNDFDSFTLDAPYDPAHTIPQQNNSNNNNNNNTSSTDSNNKS
eukprot:TRINITY_DN66300_c2_g1_i1.p1 TRINITY_DN66300_c2_g1~~TRINITY_DN66300_c2_g1_i1.p1  ORF type:complete len:233 (+),score=126.62 TRINITY_DN66300_c2_g1_i1:230-928(+)